MLVALVGLSVMKTPLAENVYKNNDLYKISPFLEGDQGDPI